MVRLISKREKTRQSVNLALGGGITSITFTSTGTKHFVDLIASVNLGTQDITDSNASFGPGIMKYEGSEWQAGSVFIGALSSSTESDAKKPSLLRLSGEAGEQVLTKLLKSPVTKAMLAKCKVGKINGFIQMDTPDIIKNAEAFKLSAKSLITKAESSRVRTKLSLTKDKFTFNSKSSTRYVEFSFSNNRIEMLVQFSDNAADEFMSALAESNVSSAQVAGHFVFNLISAFEDLGDYKVILEQLKKIFKLGQVLINIGSFGTLKKIKSVLTPEEKRMKAACTALVNKLTAPAFSLSAQQVVLPYLFEELKTQKSLITDVEAFFKKLKESLT